MKPKLYVKNSSIRLFNVICHYAKLHSETFQIVAYSEEHAMDLAKQLATDKGYVLYDYDFVVHFEV